jgi:hypothetical protein
VQSFTIAVMEGTSPARKITKIVTYADGGFGVLVPYHAARRGYMFKMPVDYQRDRGRFFKAWDTMAAEFTADDAVKLSIHADGFVQFSGVRSSAIRSGRLPETGKAKGLGYQGIPLSTPIVSGPTFGVAVWGLDQFEELRRPALATVSDEKTIVFDEHDIEYRDDAPSKCNAYLLEGCVFHRRSLRDIVIEPGRTKVAIWHDYAPGGPRLINFVPVVWDNPLVFIGLLCTRVHMGFPSPSGWQLNAPSDAAKRHVLTAMYPLDEALIKKRSDRIGSLNYEPEVETGHASEQPVSGETESGEKSQRS